MVAEAPGTGERLSANRPPPRPAAASAAAGTPGPSLPPAAGGPAGPGGARRRYFRPIAEQAALYLAVQMSPTV